MPSFLTRSFSSTLTSSYTMTQIQLTYVFKCRHKIEYLIYIYFMRSDGGVVFHGALAFLFWTHTDIAIVPNFIQQVLNGLNARFLTLPNPWFMARSLSCYICMCGIQKRWQPLEWARNGDGEWERVSNRPTDWIMTDRHFSIEFP